MKEVLHIFRKDVRRHWAEILAALALVGIFVWVALDRAGNRMSYDVRSFPLATFFKEMIIPLLVFFWVFLAVRVVHGETLVGDRQWWITKPYEWWKLLAAKQLFLIVFLSGPLFLAQLYLLYVAHFPVLRNLGGVLNMQIGLALILLLPGVTLGALTKNLGQAVIGVILVFVGFWATSTLMEKVPGNAMSFAVEQFGEVTAILALASVVGAMGWQYARRRTWASRGLLVAGVGSIILLNAVMPYAWFVERNYPLVSEAEAPARVTVVAPQPTKHAHRNPIYRIPQFTLNLPIQIDGVVPGHVVLLQGVRIVVEMAGGSKWDPGWQPQSADIWAVDEPRAVTYYVPAKDFERFKQETSRLHIDLLLADYEGTAERQLIVPDGTFSDPQLGLCQLGARVSTEIECKRPFQNPSLMATFDPAQAKCSQVVLGENEVAETQKTHVWLPPGDGDAPAPGFDPVADYQLFFGASGWRASDSSGKTRVVRLCSGAPVKLAVPIEKKHVRVAVEIENVKLQDLVEDNSY